MPVPVFDAQILQAPHRTDDVQDAVDSADFMEMDLVDRHAVYLGFGFSQGLEDGQALGLDIFIDRGAFDDLRDFRQAPVLMVVMMACRIDEVALPFIMMLRVFMMGVFMAVMVMMMVMFVAMTF